MSALIGMKVIKRSERIVLRLTKGVEFLLKKNGVDIIKGLASIQSDKSVIVDDQLFETENIIIATGSKPMGIRMQFQINILHRYKDY